MTVRSMLLLEMSSASLTPRDCELQAEYPRPNKSAKKTPSCTTTTVKVKSYM